MRVLLGLLMKCGHTCSRGIRVFTSGCLRSSITRGGVVHDFFGLGIGMRGRLGWLSVLLRRG